MGIHSVPEKIKGRNAENRLGSVDYQPVEDTGEICKVLFRRRGRNKDVIDIDKRMRDPLEDSVHKTLEILASVLQAEWVLRKI